MHIFISYAKVDTYDLAVQLRDQLRQLDGVTVWMDETLEPGESWALQIQEEIDAADYVVVLLSPDVNRPVQPHQRRSFVLNEIDYAQQSNKTIIPVMARKTRVPVQIAGVQFIDFTGDPTKGYTRLLRKIAPHINQPPTTPITLPPSPPPASKPFTGFKNPFAAIPRRWLVIGLVGILALVVVVFVVIPALNDRTSFEDAPDALATMAALAPANQALQTATSVARTQAADSQLAANQTSIAATGVIKTQEKQLELATTEANGVATGVVATQENQDQLATNEASIAETGVVKTQAAAGIPTDTPVPVVPVVTSNADWASLYQVFDGVEMALVPPGCFMMGQNNDDVDFGPAHEQCFDQPFWIDRYEVTRQQFGMAASPTSNRPYDEVSQYKAINFCTSRGARLPTEREWEYAARGPSDFLYPWGDDFVAENVVYVGNSNDESAAVGSRPAGNSWVGASDMSGNVWEWVSSVHQRYPYNLSAESQGDLSDDSVRFVMRGGSWNTDADALRSVWRYGYPPYFEIAGIGFRCARDYTPADIAMPASLRANTDWHAVYRLIDGIEMAYVPAGCFTMGQDGGEEDQAPAGEQCIDQPFWIDRYEVTNAQFGSTGNFTADNQPRDSVSWFEARDFCEAREGSRLPTEPEWEYAARGPSNFVYPWGNNFIADNVVYIDNANDQTAPVGSRPAGNSWVGASDMSGNLLEWVRSRYMNYPYDVSDGREVNGDDTEMIRVLRGGSYKDNANQSALRFDDYPMNAYVNFGFRCIRLS
ncbi:MAG: SUMF1/EgtB/PvdO family nonheme iron enzyme [Chloroflexi bacterium]|nr:SUMF1/EgtB/PvdO family nonheme iron enzyme [Chloroflexota bacterium]MCC6894417.1 SUMF1/EgtB/PvdO family nonheme iron enzyme [Anaerolineae bacterium]